jgi:predicted ATPase/DNA-binding SARP family transcriptional activator
VLGPLEVTSGGTELRYGGPKQRALLAFLLLRANEAVGRDRLIEAVWGDDPPATAANALQVHVHGLRKLLGPGRLETRGNAYLLHVEPGELDVERFEDLVRQARAVDDPATRLDRLQGALELWRGSALADLAELPFAELESQRLEEARVAALELRIDAELALGRDDGLVAELERLVAENPYRERLRAQLMVALYRAGRQADALAAFQQARRVLVEELGIDPSRELQELERAILRQDAALTVEPAELRARRRLPAPPTALIGRRQEVGEVCALLAADARLVTLTGPGGTGKTRVALQAAYEVAEHFADGVVFVELAALQDPALVLGEIAGALEVANGRDAHAALAAHLRERTELLVIDNFEQVDEAAPALGSLLHEAPGLKFLVTSRRPLRVYGEHEFPVAPLALDEEAVPLFLERASAVGRSLQPSDDVREICRRLDCLPLALEIAAARARELTPAEMRSLLSSRLELASGGPRDLPARQQTLRATIEWSRELLDAGERRLFAGLGVFAGGWTKDAAGAVCDADPPTLAALAEKSLVVRQGERFGMLETIREYAVARLREELDEAALRRRHAEYFVDLAVRAVPELKSASAAASLERLAAEHDNLRAALDWAFEHEPDACVRLVDALYLFWYIRGHYREGLHWYGRALTIAGADPSARAGVAGRGGALAFACGEFALARVRINEALLLHRSLGDTPNIVRGLALLGLIATNAGEHDEAVALLEESTALAREAGDENVLSFALSNLGYVTLTTGDLDRAYAVSLEAIELHRARPPEQLQLAAFGAALGNLGVTALLQGRLDEARTNLAESVSVRREIRDALGMASVFTGVAALAAEERGFARAARLLGAVDAVREQTDAELEPIDTRLYERTAAGARAELGEEAFAREREEGRNLGLDEAAELALEGTEPRGAAA